MLPVKVLSNGREENETDAGVDSGGNGGLVERDTSSSNLGRRGSVEHNEGLNLYLENHGDKRLILRVNQRC